MKNRLERQVEGLNQLTMLILEGDVDLFKYYLNLDNEFSYHNCYELHKKSCPIVKQLQESGTDQLMELGFFANCREAVQAGKEALSERGLDPGLLNGCLACNKECHKR